MSLLVLWLAIGQAASARGDFDAKAVFDGQCAACHTVGQGDDVGPDLAGVTERRDPEWLIAFIRSSQTVIRSGDALAGDLFERYGRQKMPDHDFSPEQIGEILAYVEAGGPSSGPVLRLASEATDQDVERGRLLFLGMHPESQAVACASCHSLSESGSSGRFLGGSLAGVYSRYYDVELAKSLEGMADLPILANGGHDLLTADESFWLRAYLRSIDEEPSIVGPTVAESYPLLGFGSGLALIALCGVIQRRSS